MRVKNIVPILLVLLLSGTGTALAGTSYAWRDHAPPFDFLFGNHIDTHQQGKVAGNGWFKGFFYIKYTGEVTPDGVAVAEHGNCPETPEICTVGWLLQGVPLQAQLVAHEEGEHPTWCVDPADLPAQPGFSHFHWIGAPAHAGAIEIGDVYDGYLLKLTAIDTFFFAHHGGFLVTPGIDTQTHANIVTDCAAP